MGTAAADWTGMSATHQGDDRLGFLYRTHGEDLRAYCRRRLEREEAEDALAEVFAIAWRRLEKVPPGHEARLWLYGVARNVIRNSTRSTRRRLRLTTRLIGSTNPPTPGPAESMVTRSEHQDVLAALDTLRPSDQELLRLHAWEELSREEIAQVLGISTPAVDMRLHRAIARLNRALESRGFEGHSTSRAQDRGGMP
jgi:RNA polymerase sigma-70 factor (ECF subfamily)